MFCTYNSNADRRCPTRSRGYSEKLSFDEVRAELLLAGKVAAKASLQKQDRKVAMVGDGINAYPALAQANVG